MTKEVILNFMKKMKGANMDIDFDNDNKNIHWKQDECPWNKNDKNKKHKCAVKSISICKHFKGIEYPDVVLCSYVEK
jgi:hypothetical protein